MSRQRAMLLLVILTIPTSGMCDDGALCPAHLSIPITNGETQADGSVIHGHFTFPTGSHWVTDNATRRGCVCNLGPCVRKCCGPGQIVAETLSKLGQCVRDTEYDDDSLLLDADRVAPNIREELTSRPDLRDWFTVFESPSCAENHVFMDLSPDTYPEDAYELQSNGSLWLPTQGLLPVGHFCMDRRAGGADGLAVLACLQADVLEDETPTAVRVGYLLSIPFLAVTFLVYAIIPELRNIYGKTLMCYVVSLLSAYSSISIAHFFSYGRSCHVTGEYFGSCRLDVIYLGVCFSLYTNCAINQRPRWYCAIFPDIIPEMAVYCTRSFTSNLYVLYRRVFIQLC